MEEILEEMELMRTRMEEKLENERKKAEDAEIVLEKNKEEIRVEFARKTKVYNH